MTPRRRRAGIVYLSAFVQGLVGVAFPASATVLRARGLTDAQYGSLFVPQLTLAALGAIGAGAILHRLGARRALALGLGLMALSQVGLLLAGSVPSTRVYPTVLLGAALLGLGAGVSAGPLNAYPQALFPRRSESAVLALHTAAGCGLAVIPVLAGGAIALGAWGALPASLLASCLALAVVVLRADLPDPDVRELTAAAERTSATAALWLFLGVAFAYGVTESVYGNWAVVFLTEERALGAASAGAALTSFWTLLAIGRLAVAALVLRLAAAPVLPAAAVLMALATLLVPGVETARGALVYLGLGGLGCSAVFPLVLALAGRRFPAQRSWVSSAVFAALCAGLAAGSLSAGLLRSLVPLATVYRLAAVPAALAAVLALAAARHRP